MRRRRAPAGTPGATSPVHTESRQGYREYALHPIRGWEHFERFASLSAVASLAGEHTNGHDTDTYWAGGTREQAVAWATQGWPEGVKKAQAMASRLADRVLQSRSAEGVDILPDVIGAAYDVGAYVSGQPECWLMPTPAQAKRSISIAFNVSASADVDADTLMRRGLAVLALTLALNAKGYPITVDLCQTTTNKTACFVTRIADASTGSQLDVDRLAFALGHPTMFRQIYSSVTGRWWGPCQPASDTYPDDTEYDLRIGGAHLRDAERWQDGGESWVLSEYVRQTQG